ncbi:MAG TPA: SIMPL domain-containing protein [Hyphomicrobiaceae bacterium]|nr:SIMPL domain-containing protein [Hyphomicrobiaceae bacterium]
MSALCRWLLAAGVLAGMVFLQARMVMAADANSPSGRTVSVTGTGRVAADPDIAQVSAGVVVEAETAKDALARNSTIMVKLIDGLKAFGVAAKDIQTSSINVEPRYAQAKDGKPATISGYRVVNQVRLTVRDVKRLGEILDGAIALGANQMGGVAFDVTNPEALLDDARKEAVASARRRAELYAAAAGVQLGEVLRIAEEAGDGPRPMPMARAAMAGAVPIEPGTRTLTIEVHVTYALR